MTADRRIGVEPLSFGITGFKIEDLFVKDFITELREELPTSIIAHFCIGFIDSKDIVAVSYDRRDEKYKLDRVDIEGTEKKQIEHVVEVLKRVLVK